MKRLELYGIASHCFSLHPKRIQDSIQEKLGHYLHFSRNEPLFSECLKYQDFYFFSLSRQAHIRPSCKNCKEIIVFPVFVTQRNIGVEIKTPPSLTMAWIVTPVCQKSYSETTLIRMLTTSRRFLVQGNITLCCYFVGVKVHTVW